MHGRSRTVVALAALVLAAGAWPAAAGQTVILVGGSREAGKAAARRLGARWVRSLTVGFARAARAMEGDPAARVELRLAAGEYTGDLGSGAYAIPRLVAPRGALVVSGGWDETFSRRDPFHHPSTVLATPERSAPLWTFARGSRVGQLIVDGLVWDSGPSNRYDRRSNSLLPGSSCTFPFVKFNYLETDRLAFLNCVFLNSAARVMEPLVRAMTPRAVIEFRNSIFLNDRIPLKLDSARFRNRPARIVVDRCSFLLDWPYDPDPGTGNRGALELGPADAAREIRITRNLFWADIGGAIQAAHGRLPDLVISGNDFVGNGLLHGRTEPDAGAMIVAVGGRMQDIPVEMIEEVPAVVEAEGNVSVAPGIPLTVGSPTVVDSSRVRAEGGWENAVRRILGMNLQGGRVAIHDFAPRKAYDPRHPPVPTVPAAARYGADPDHLATP